MLEGLPPPIYNGIQAQVVKARDGIQTVHTSAVGLRGGIHRCLDWIVERTGHPQDGPQQVSLLLGVVIGFVSGCIGFV